MADGAAAAAASKKDKQVQLTLQQKVDIIHKRSAPRAERPTMETLARDYEVATSTISRVCSDRDKILAAHLRMGIVQAAVRQRVRPSELFELEEILWMWFETARNYTVPVTWECFHHQAKNIRDKLLIKLEPVGYAEMSADDRQTAVGEKIAKNIEQLQKFTVRVAFPFCWSSNVALVFVES